MSGDDHEAAQREVTARDDLGAAVRALVDTVAATAAGEVQLQAATAAIVELTDSLAAAGARRSRIDNPFHPGSLVGGTAHPFAPQLRFSPDGGAGEGVVGEGVLGASFEGGPGLVHGGILATIFDHVMGSAMFLAGYGAMTRTLDIRYLAPTRLHIPLQARARVDRVDGRRVIVVGTISQDGAVTAEAESVFVQLTAENVAAIFARTGSS